MQSWWKRLNKKYNKTEKRIAGITLCCLLVFIAMGITEKPVSATGDVAKLAYPTTTKYAVQDDVITVIYTVTPYTLPKEKSNSSYSNGFTANYTLNFNLNDNFDYVQNSVSSNMTLNSNTSTQLSFNVPITYSVTSGTRNMSFTVQQSSLTVSFKIKPKLGKTGALTFASSGNNITYNTSTTATTSQNVSAPTINVMNTDPSTIKILEVEPANSFKLTDNTYTGDSRTITGHELALVGSSYVGIDHISMPEFVGKVDKLNGKYDVIVLGRSVDTSLPNTSYQFRDYVNLENDITNRKATEIKDFIDSGQLVYVDSRINKGDLSGSKLVNNFFASSDSHSNFIKNVSVDDLKLDSIVSDYNSNKKLKPAISVTQSPTGDTGSSNIGSIDNRKLNFKFNIAKTELSSEQVTVNLYLDMNGDGLFKDSEIVQTINNLTIPQDNVELYYTLTNKEFFGYLDWKIEVIRNNNIKSYTTGSFTLKKLDGVTRVINVLQIDTDNDSNNTHTSSEGYGGVLDLKNNIKFQGLVTEIQNLGYQINITRTSVTGFNNMTKNLTADSQSILNGQYNMIILGFSDCFPMRVSGDSSLSNNSLDEIMKFGKTHQGIMFTHDNLWYTGGTIYNNVSNDRYREIQKFQDYIGQSRYNNLQNTNIDLQGNAITHDPDKPGNGTNGQKEGSTTWSRNDVNTSESKIVYNTNKAIITNYPYALGDTIDVRRTHGQYLQLNLEDENVVPWFDLTSNNGDKGTSSNINQYDVRNNFYIYSMGNITFSGTGENTRDTNEYPDSEMKLFMNTIVKAERGANHAPTIETKNLNDVVSKYQDNFDFQVIPYDLDNDHVDVTVKIQKATVDGSGNKNWEDVKSIPYLNNKSGAVLNVDINKSDIFNDSKDYKYLRVYITATDEHGAEATPIQKEIQVVDTPLLNIDLAADKTGYLVGDTVNLNATVSVPNINNGKNVDYSNIQMNLDQYSNNGVIEFTGSDSDKILDFGSKNVNSSSTTLAYKGFKITDKSTASTTEEQSYSISSKYSYSLNDGTLNMSIPNTNIPNNTISETIKVRKGQLVVTAKGIGTSGNYDVNLGIAPKVQVKKSGNLITEGYIDANSGQVTFDNISSGQYDVYIDSVNGYDILNNPESVEVNYDNNIGRANFQLVPSVRNIQHGLYKSVDSGELSVISGQSELARGAIGTLAVGCDIVSSNVSIELQINKNVDIISNSNPIKIYQIINGQLSEISGASYTIGSGTGNNNSYIINLPAGINSETKLVILYPSEIPTNSEITGPFVNTAIINGKPFDFTLKISSQELPDLF
jgi:hypothetical protein